MNALELIYALGALTVILIFVLLISENINLKHLDKWLTEEENPDSKEVNDVLFDHDDHDEANQDDDTSYHEAESDYNNIF